MKEYIFFLERLKADAIAWWLFDNAKDQHVITTMSLVPYGYNKSATMVHLADDNLATMFTLVWHEYILAEPKLELHTGKMSILTCPNTTIPPQSR